MNADSPYKHILVPLENSRVDETILAHVRRLAEFCGARLTLIHVADGFMARNQQNLADSPEMKMDRDYLEAKRAALAADGFEVQALLACGEPSDEILNCVQKCRCDLIAMATHGHRGLSDVILGSVASNIRHRTEIPVLLIKAPAV